jgi:uncharacterized membrane protein YdbT with pleckstrin-like domain
MAQGKTFLSNNGMGQRQPQEEQTIAGFQRQYTAKQLRERWSLALVVIGAVIACIFVAFSPWPWVAGVILGAAIYHTGVMIGKD